MKKNKSVTNQSRKQLTTQFSNTISMTSTLCIA
jgi:hypothetical protein